MDSIIKTSKGNCVIHESGIYFIDKQENFQEKMQLINSKNNSIKINNNSKKTLSKIAIFLSEDCNLRCIYCYANSGKRDVKVSVDNAKTLIDFICTKADKIILDFHGGGEPLLYFDIIKELHDYVKNKNKLYKTVLITNGYIENNKDEILHWITNNVDILAISCDGTPEIQNTNRPHVNNLESYKEVEDTIKKLVAKNYNFTVRSTVTNNSVSKLYDIIKYFHSLGVHNVIFSPCYNFGRSSDIKLIPNAKQYSESFMEAFKYAYENKINIRTNSFRLPGRNYCGALPGFNIALTTDGYISTCYEVIDSKDKSGNMFIVGKIENNTVKFFKEKIEKLNKIENLDYSCSHCSYKLVCRGGCPIKHVRNSKEASNNLCTITKLLVPKILDFIHSNPDSANIILRNTEIDIE